MVTVHIFGGTDTGKLRPSNQDHLLIGSLDSKQLLELDEPTTLDASPRGPLMLVCDGMGGTAGGEVAAQLAAKVLWGEMCAAQETEERPVYARLMRRAVRVANRRVFEEGNADPALRGMGTTLSAAGVVGDALVLAQVGDSRAYIHRGKTLTQVTRDQSIVSALMHSGRMTSSEARTSGQSSVILQALGCNEDVEVSLSIVELRAGDRLLLCSDGLHGLVGDDRLRATLVSCDDLAEAVRTLIALARKAGGPDNITAVIAEFTGDGLREPRNMEDLPRFVEFDPMEEGDRAMSTTSKVARRLAARAGIGDDPGPPVVPVTGQYVALATDDPPPSRAPQAESPPSQSGPAYDALRDQDRLGTTGWLAAGIVLLVVAGFLVWAVG